MGGDASVVDLLHPAEATDPTRERRVRWRSESIGGINERIQDARDLSMGGVP